MTKLLISDAFLPSGGVEAEMPAAACYANGNSSSILSPLSSSKSASSGAATATNPRYSPLPPHVDIDYSSAIPSASPVSIASLVSPPSLAAIANATATASLPPLPTAQSSPAGSNRLQSLAFLPTSSSLSFPPCSDELSSETRAFESPSSLQQLAPNGAASATNLRQGLDNIATLARSLSADGAASQPSPTHLVQRLTQQNALIRDAWEAERNYLEANRRRAEEVYQEERAIMEDVRESWNIEKVEMQRELQALRERVQRLEGENSALKTVTAQSVQVTGVLSPLASQRGDSVDSSSDSPSYFSIVPGAAASVTSHNMVPRKHGGVASPDVTADLPLGLDGASRRPHFASPVASRTSPSKLPDPASSIIDPRTQPETSTPRDFLADSSENNDETPVPVIDVQEIDPKLEGISLKANAVQKSTFAELSQSSPAISPPAKVNGNHAKSLKPTIGKRNSSKEHTMKVLAAEESHRLTMHAGHTPNHSLSLFPTMTTATETGTATGRSEGTTPTASSAPPERHDETGVNESHRNHSGHAHPVEEVNGSHTQTKPQDPFVDDFEEPLLEPADDIPLKGPLMVKNIPAQDELFWAALNKKLEPISQGQDALPTVVQTPIAELEAAPLSTVPIGGGDAAQDSRKPSIDDQDVDEANQKPLERDVPLKLKCTSNFGAPFGMM